MKAFFQGKRGDWLRILSVADPKTCDVDSDDVDNDVFLVLFILVFQAHKAADTIHQDIIQKRGRKHDV